MMNEVFWMGIIENNNDPLKLGRCQVRIMGIHTENKGDTSKVNYIPTEDLPWAQVMFPVSSPNISGQCDFMVPKNGSVVVCVFIDPEQQIPIILGTTPKIANTRPNYEEGFSDPDEVHPISDLLGQSQISRLARNEDIANTIIQDKKDTVKTSVSCANTTWNEPQTPYDAEYTKNRVIETEHHFVELDDTDGKERIHIYHKTGTSKEMHPNGDEVNRVKNKRFTIITDDDNILIESDRNVRVAGNENVTIVGNETVKIQGNSDIEITGNKDLKVTGNTTINVTGQTKVTSSGPVTLTSYGIIRVSGPQIYLN
jgi:hypothetical protein